MKRPVKKPSNRRAAKHKDAMPMPTKIDMRPRKSTAQQRAQAERFWEAFGGKPKPRKAAKSKRVAKPGVRMWVTHDSKIKAWIGRPSEKPWPECWERPTKTYFEHQTKDGDLVKWLRRAGLKRLPKPGECIPIRMVILED